MPVRMRFGRIVIRSDVPTSYHLIVHLFSLGRCVDLTQYLSHFSGEPVTCLHNP